eukprot:gb/GECG01012658.1/.p1 GENE.gb/GECG01012658.1/~~gb/GECG01012658.1/.p1  ORF type:complete len:1289 (+),score=128.38 gb/GECG01012658.1/:1-3867(+)
MASSAGSYLSSTTSATHRVSSKQGGYSYSYSHAHPVLRSPDASAFAFEPTGKYLSHATTWKNDILRHNILNVPPHRTGGEGDQDRSSESSSTSWMRSDLTDRTCSPSATITPTSEIDDHTSIDAIGSQHALHDSVATTSMGGTTVVASSAGDSTHSGVSVDTQMIQPSLYDNTALQRATMSTRPLVQLFQDRGSWLVERRLLDESSATPVAAESSESLVSGFYADITEAMRERVLAGYGSNFLHNYNLCATAAAHSQTLLGPQLHDGRRRKADHGDSHGKHSQATQGQSKAVHKTSAAADIKACLCAIAEDSWGSTNDDAFELCRSLLGIGRTNAVKEEAQASFVVPDEWWAKIERVHSIRRLRTAWEWLSGLCGTRITLTSTKELLSSLQSSGWLCNGRKHRRPTANTPVTEEISNTFGDPARLPLPLNGLMVQNMMDRVLGMYRHGNEWSVEESVTGESKRDDSLCNVKSLGPISLSSLINHRNSLGNVAEIEATRSLAFYCCDWPILPLHPLALTEKAKKERHFLPWNVDGFMYPSDTPEEIADGFAGNLGRAVENGRWERAVGLCSVVDIFLVLPYLSEALRKVNKIGMNKTVPSLGHFPASLFGCTWSARLLKYLAEGVEIGAEDGENKGSDKEDRPAYLPLDDGQAIDTSHVHSEFWWDLRKTYGVIANLLEAYISLSNATFHQSSLGYEADSAYTARSTETNRSPIEFARNLVTKWLNLKTSIEHMLQKLKAMWTVDGLRKRHRHPYLIMLLSVMLFSLPVFKDSRKINASTAIPNHVQEEFACCLADEGLELHDRVGLALTVLPLEDALEFASHLIGWACSFGDIRGISLNGLPGSNEVQSKQSTSSSESLLRNFVDHSADVQTASLFCLAIDPYTVTTAISMAVEAWWGAYVGLLDRWRCWHHRAALDVVRSELAMRYKAARGHQHDPLWHPFFAATQRRHEKRATENQRQDASCGLRTARLRQVRDTNAWFEEVSEWIKAELISERAHAADVLRLAQFFLSYLHMRPTLNVMSIVTQLSELIHSTLPVAKTEDVQEWSSPGEGSGSQRTLPQRGNITAHIREGAGKKPLKGRSPLSLSTPTKNNPVPPLQSVPPPESLHSVLPFSYRGKFPSMYSPVETRLKGSPSPFQKTVATQMLNRNVDMESNESDTSLMRRFLGLSYVFPTVPLSFYGWGVLTQTVTYAPSEYMRCSFCDKPLTLPYFVKNSAASLAWLNEQGPRLRCCPLCQKVLPKCSLSLLSMRVVNPARRIVQKDQLSTYEKEFSNSSRVWSELFFSKSS